MRIRLNGCPEDLPDGGGVAAVLERLGIDDARGVAVAVDGEVVPRSRWSSTTLADGQAVEVLHAVQGG